MARKLDRPVNSRLRPAGCLYWLLAVPAALLLRLLFSLRIRKEPSIRRIRGPVILLGNHPSYLDPLIMAVALLPRRIRFLTTRDLFRSRVASTLLGWLGAIPKTQFRTDLQAVKSVLRTLRHGGAVALYPEGQRSIDGILQPIDDSLFKLLKKADCPVVLVKVQGAYLAWPRWARGLFRPGRIQASVSLLFDQGDVRRLPLETLRRRILQAMFYDEYRQQQHNRYRYRTRQPAAGMADICHQCPACGRELAMVSSARALTCRYCGNQGLVDATGLIRPAPALPGRIQNKVWPDAARWHRWQISLLKQEMARGICSRSCSAVLTWPDEPERQEEIKGTLLMSGQRLSFREASDLPDARETALTLPLTHRGGICAMFGRYFDIAHADRVYRFTLDPGQAVILLSDMVQAYEN